MFTKVLGWQDGLSLKGLILSLQAYTYEKKDIFAAIDDPVIVVRPVPSVFRSDHLAKQRSHRERRFQKKDIISALSDENIYI